MYLWIARCSSELRLFLVSRTLRTSLNFDGEYVRFNSTSKKKFFFILCVKYGLKLDYDLGYSHHQRFLVMGLDTAQQFYDPFTQQHIAWHWKLAGWCGTILCFGNADKPQIWIKFLGNFHLQKKMWRSEKTFNFSEQVCLSRSSSEMWSFTFTDTLMGAQISLHSQISTGFEWRT